MKLTKKQKYELDLLKKGGGGAHVFCGNLMRTMRALEKKGLVVITAGWGQFQAGHYVSLKP